MKKALTITVITIAFLAVFIGGHFLCVHLMSMEHNLVKANVSNSVERLEVELEDSFIELTDFKMHYVAIGSGYPLVLVHGNGSNYTKLEDLGRRLANDYRVYIVESRCHGQSESTNEISYDLMADDLCEFITKMNLDKPIIIGHSDGGINALTFAIRHPDKLAGLVSFGANTHPREFKLYFPAMVWISNLFNKSILNNLMLNLPDITKEQLNAINVPTYIMAGEFDIVKLSNTVYMAEQIPNSRLTILQGEDHSSYVHDGRRSYSFVKEFIEDVLGE